MYSASTSPKATGCIRSTVGRWKTVFEGDYDNVRVTEKDNGEGVITIYVEATTDKIPDVKPEGGSNSGFDVDVDGWGMKWIRTYR